MSEKDEIVISGLAGRYPECNNTEELKEALLNGVDLVTDDERRFPKGIMGIPPRCGKIPELDKFDSTYFGVHAKQAEFMDPRHRILCETVYEAIVDAGYNPKELRGTKTGVYVAMGMLSTAEELRNCENNAGYVNIGVCQAMAANRVSYCFDFKGKSYTMDTACSSAMYGLVNAVEDIRNGTVDAAVVCGAHVIFHPNETSEFNKLNMLAADGKCKVFSTLRDGYVRGEAIATIILQKKGVSRRVYATVAGVGSNADGYKVEGITYPSSDMQLQLMDEIYSTQGIDEDEVTYVEAHGTGTQAGDLQELKAILKKFCKNRSTPLLTGGVKSNMGHSEVSAGLCSISKVLIAMETGVIPANLHTDPMDLSLPGVKDRKIKIVTKNLRWNGGTVAVNCFGFGGANSHVVLRSNPKEKAKGYKAPKCRLVQVSGRTEEAVNHFLEEVEKNRDDEEFLALVDEVYKMNCESHYYRGYTVLGEHSKREVGKYLKPRPIWFIYTGMGAQWLGMGKDMMNNRIFSNTIQRCAVALKPYNIDLVDILTSTSPKVFEDSTNCFVGIAAMEIAMTDVLYSLGIIPDGIAGHSLGEVSCSYADGQITPEEAILLAYARGYASRCVKLPAGAMAAVGLSREDCLKVLPDDISIACQNGKGSVTLSGPEQSIFSFVDKMKSQQVFAKAVSSGGLAYHSKYIADAVPHLYDFARNVLKTPKPRSPKWVSTSVNENQRNESWTRYNCAEYHRNNFANPVLFDEVYKHIPENAIVVEVSPHGLMQAILKRELNPSNTILSLANRSSTDNEEFFLSSIGKIYIAGGQPNLKKIYDGVSYPVGRGTKMLSPLVKWDHSVSWLVPLWKHKVHFGKTIRVNISEEQYAYLGGHNIDGRILMPATAYLELAWRTLAHLYLKNIEDLPVVIEDIRLKRATVLSPNTDVEFIVNIMKQSGEFTISEGGTLVCTGTIYTTKDVSQLYSKAIPPKKIEQDYLPLTTEDLYKECHLRRYLYEGVFKSIHECDVNGSRGRIKWQGNFVSFLDSMLHIVLIAATKRELLLPTEMKRVIIDPREHLQQMSGEEDIPIFYNGNVNVIRSGAIEIKGLDLSKAPRRKQGQEPLLETYEFLPYRNNSLSSLDTCLSAAVQIVLQNIPGYIKSLKICHFSGDTSNTLVSNMKDILGKQPMVDAEFIKYTKNDDQTAFDAIVLTEDSDVDVDVFLKRLHEDGMILYQGDISKITRVNLDIIYSAQTATDHIYLLSRNHEPPSDSSVIHISNSDLQWLDQIKQIIQTHNKQTVFLVNQDEDYSGIIGLMKCLMTEPSSVRFRCVLIQDVHAGVFSLDHEFYMEQLSKNLTFNVLRGGKWGSFVHLPIELIADKEVQDATVSILTIGDLASLRWSQRSSNYISNDSASEKVFVYYSSLNFKDVMVATGKLLLPQVDQPTVPEINIGIEYSGVTTSGRRVMGMVANEALSLQLNTDPNMTWEVPKKWSLDEAATVPVVYATCYYAMLIKGHMKPGESILIHAGTGGIGLAAISIALSMGCEVFTTAGSKEKRQYLRIMYPEIMDENIADSRSTSFINMVMENTEGKGVDLVLNSLAGELFKESLACVAPMGRFLEIGKVEFVNNTLIETKMFIKNCSFHGISLDEIFYSNEYVKREIQELVDEGIKNGVVRPLPRTIYREEEVEDAFRFLSSGKHKGKILIELRKEHSSMDTSLVRKISAIPKIYFDPNKSYILVGGLGGIGLELTDWMVRRGATKIILNSRRNISNGYQSYCLKRWSKWKGITIKINTDDTSTLKGARSLVSFANILGPVGGVFNMALVLMDGLIENQTTQMFETVFKPKITSGRNMDVVTRMDCPTLDHFLVFSSAACGRGNSGQSNYGMANSVLEQLCEKRRKDNLPALAVQWGPIGEVGALIGSKIINKLADQMVAQNISSCIETLERFMLLNPVIGSSMVIPNKTAAKSRDTTKTPAEAVAHILGIRNLDTIDKSLTMVQLGLDSLMSAEIKQTLYRNYNIEMNTNEIRDLTFTKLMDGSDTDENNNSAPHTNGTTEKIYDITRAILSKEPIVVMNRPATVSKPIFLIHPIEGHLECLKPIASQLNALVYGIQSVKDANFDNIQDYASYYIRHIKEKQPSGPYLLCGYSFGAVVALEMGLQLEKQGEHVQIVLLDGAPAYSKIILEDHFAKIGKSVEKSKTAILVNFVSTLTSIEKDRAEKQLQTTEGSESQFQCVGDLVTKDTGLDPEQVSAVASGYYNRHLACINYNPEGMFNGKVLLIRVNSHQLVSSEDYNLHQVCKQKVDILKLKGDHNTVVLGDNSSIISKKINTLI